MNYHSSDSQRDALLRRALIPKGYRPTKLEDVEKMLDAIGDQPVGESKLQRMLRKVSGQEPMFLEHTSPAPKTPDQLTAKEQEVYALCRSKNKPLPPDLAAKVNALERKAGRNREPNGDISSD